MDSQTTDAILAAGGGGALSLVLNTLWSRFVAKGQRAEEQTETKQAATMDRLLDMVSSILRSVDVLKEGQTADRKLAEKFDERLEAISKNHGTRLALIETTTTENKTRLDLVMSAKWAHLESTLEEIKGKVKR